jgi:hypothetical protein
MSPGLEFRGESHVRNKQWCLYKRIFSRRAV